jgi:hypothetical protein
VSPLGKLTAERPLFYDKEYVRIGNVLLKKRKGNI